MTDRRASTGVTPLRPRSVTDILRELRVLIDELDAATLPPRGEFRRDASDHPKGAKLLTPGYAIAVAGKGVVATVGQFGGYLYRHKDGTPAARSFDGPTGPKATDLDLSRSINPRR